MMGSPFVVTQTDNSTPETEEGFQPPVVETSSDPSSRCMILDNHASRRKVLQSTCSWNLGEISVRLRPLRTGLELDVQPFRRPGWCIVVRHLQFPMLRMFCLQRCLFLLSRGYSAPICGGNQVARAECERSENKRQENNRDIIGSSFGQRNSSVHKGHTGSV